MKKLLPFIILFAAIFILIVACVQNNRSALFNGAFNSGSFAVPGNQTNEGVDWPSPQDMTPFSFLHAVQMKGTKSGPVNIITMTDDFPRQWLKRSDIDSLLSLVNSKDRCNCFVSPRSSQIPVDSAELGGYAISLLRAYRQKQPVSFGLYACPKTDAQEAAALVAWWEQQRQIAIR